MRERHLWLLQRRWQNLSNQEFRETRYAPIDVFNLEILISDIASGITPKVDEDYYTDSSGIPFLRVQNITAQGIDLSDTKFIKREVHEGMLKRSQLKKDDLVFTITGRIGSVAVVPDNFEGNINQHSVRFHLKAQIANININPRYVAFFLTPNLVDLWQLGK